MNVDTIRQQFSETPGLTYNTDPQILIDELLPLALNYVKTVDTIPFHRPLNPKEISTMFESLPSEHGISLAIIKTIIRQKIIPNFPTTTNKRFLACVPSDPVPEAMVGAMLTPFFNQFVGSVQGSQSGTAIEGLVIRWFAKLLGLPDTSFGSFTSGGSGANLTCIYTGLVYQAKEHGLNIKENGFFGNKRILVYISDQTHNAIEKAILMLGLGRRSIRVIPSNDNFEMNSETVRKAIMSDQAEFGDDILPLMIIGTAGTTNSGAIDDLDGLRSLANEYNMWFHVDGAYGAFAKLSNTPVSNTLKALENVDSLALDAHKWFYTPFEAGVALVANHIHMKNAFELSAEYLVDSELVEDYPLQRNFRSYGFPLTRELRGFKIWLMISLLGLGQMRNAITRNILQSQYLQELIRDSAQFELVSSSQLGIVCFAHREGEQKTKDILQRLQNQTNFYLSTTKLGGKTVIRACILNLRSNLETMDELFNHISILA